MSQKGIVDFWREYRKMRRNNEGDFTMERVEENFANDDLQMADKQGYTALLKACSLLSISPHLVQCLIVARKVDLNCRLPRQFDINHRAADGLVPGMSPLSVAIRRGNVNCISTFMRRRTEIWRIWTNPEIQAGRHSEMITQLLRHVTS